LKRSKTHSLFFDPTTRKEFRLDKDFSRFTGQALYDVKNGRLHQVRTTITSLAFEAQDKFSDQDIANIACANLHTPQEAMNSYNVNMTDIRRMNKIKKLKGIANNGEGLSTIQGTSFSIPHTAVYRIFSDEFQRHFVECGELFSASMFESLSREIMMILDTHAAPLDVMQQLGRMRVRSSSTTTNTTASMTCYFFIVLLLNSF